MGGEDPLRSPASGLPSVDASQPPPLQACGLLIPADTGLAAGLLHRCTSGSQTQDSALLARDIPPQGPTLLHECESHRGSRPSGLSDWSA